MYAYDPAANVGHLLPSDICLPDTNITLTLNSIPHNTESDRNNVTLTRDPNLNF